MQPETMGLPFFRPKSAEATSTDEVLTDVTKSVMGGFSIQELTTLPFPISINVSLLNDALEIDALVDPAICDPARLRQALQWQLDTHFARRDAAFSISCRSIVGNQVPDQTVLFLPGNDGDSSKLAQLYQNQPFNSVILDIIALPDDAMRQEIEFHIFKKISETGLTIDAVVGWSFGAYLSFVFAQRNSISCVLVDPPVHVGITQRDQSRAAQGSNVEISDVTKTLLKAYRPADFTYHRSNIPIEAHFTNSLDAAHFLVENSNPLVSQTLLPGCDHYTCLGSGHVRTSVQNVLDISITPDSPHPGALKPNHAAPYAPRGKR